MSREICCAEKIDKMKTEQRNTKVMKLLKRLLFFLFVLFLFAFYGWYTKIEVQSDEVYSNFASEEDNEDKTEEKETINNVVEKLWQQKEKGSDKTYSYTTAEEKVPDQRTEKLERKARRNKQKQEVINEVMEKRNEKYQMLKEKYLNSNSLLTELMQQLPTIFVSGAKKCGTKTLIRFFGHHPQIIRGEF